jgi:hypothetical protein
LIELLWGGKELKGTSGAAKAAAVSKIEQKFYAPITYGILASTVATAVLVPDIWAALSIVGDLASTMQVGGEPHGGGCMACAGDTCFCRSNSTHARALAAAVVTRTQCKLDTH